jgi:hypothetical protein
VSGQVHNPAALPPGKRLPVPIGLEVEWTPLGDAEKKKFLVLPGLELRSLGCRACSQSLYRLRYPGSNYSIMCCDKSIFILSNKENRLKMAQILRVCIHGGNSRLYRVALKHGGLLFWELSLSLFQHSIFEAGPVSELSVPNRPI